MLRLEIHCDIKPSERSQACLDCVNRIGSSARNGQEHEGAKGLRLQAKRAGWKLIPGLGWACPSCVAKRGLEAE